MGEVMSGPTHVTRRAGCRTALPGALFTNNSCTIQRQMIFSNTQGVHLLNIMV
jgi:hypothetical protein